MGFKLSAKNIAGVAAAPFTGGASLLATDVGKKAIGEITGANAAKKANEQNIALQNYWNEKNIELANTAHQREMADLKASGLNPVLAANKGASTPALESSNVENTMPGGYMTQASSVMGMLNVLAQAKSQIASTGLIKAQENATLLESAIKNELKPTTIEQAKQNLANTIAQKKLIEAQTVNTGEQTKRTKKGKITDYLGTEGTENGENIIKDTIKNKDIVGKIVKTALTSLFN